MSSKVARKPKVHIYKVEINDEVKLVRTTSRAKAIRHCLKGITASIPTQDELIQLVENGVQREDAEVAE